MGDSAEKHITYFLLAWPAGSQELLPCKIGFAVKRLAEHKDGLHQVALFLYAADAITFCLKQIARADGHYAKAALNKVFKSATVVLPARDVERPTGLPQMSESGPRLRLLLLPRAGFVDFCGQTEGLDGRLGRWLQGKRSTNCRFPPGRRLQTLAAIEEGRRWRGSRRRAGTRS